MAKTNGELAREMKTTKRQISKSRKRGFITTVDGVVKQYKAPLPEFKSKRPTGVQKNKGGDRKVWATGQWDAEKGIYKTSK